MNKTKKTFVFTIAVLMTVAACSHTNTNIQDSDSGDMGTPGINAFVPEESDTKNRLPAEWFDELDGEAMTLNDVRKFSEKGYDLEIEDFMEYRGTNSIKVNGAISDLYTVVYDVEGGHRLYVRANPDGEIDIVNFECMEQVSVEGIKHGIGIEIRHANADIDEYLRNYSN